MELSHQMNEVRAPARRRSACTARIGASLDRVLSVLGAHGGTMTVRELARELVDERDEACPSRMSRRELEAVLRRVATLGVRQRTAPRARWGVRRAFGTDMKSAA